MLTMLNRIITATLLCLVLVGAFVGFGQFTFSKAMASEMSHVSASADCDSGSCVEQDTACATHCFTDMVQSIDSVAMLFVSFVAIVVIAFLQISSPLFTNVLQPVPVRLDRHRHRILTTRKRE